MPTITCRDENRRDFPQQLCRKPTDSFYYKYKYASLRSPSSSAPHPTFLLHYNGLAKIRRGKGN